MSPVNYESNLICKHSIETCAVKGGNKLRYHCNDVKQNELLDNHVKWFTMVNHELPCFCFLVEISGPEFHSTEPRLWFNTVLEILK